MTRALLPLALLCLALAGAGLADAKPQKEKDDAREPPAHAAAHGVRRHLEPAALPSPPPAREDAPAAPAPLADEPPMPALAPPAAPATAPALEETPELQQTRAAEPAPETQGPETTPLRAEPEVRLPFAPAPRASESALAPPAQGGPAWLRALWALPLVGALGAVLLVRRRADAAPPMDLREALQRGQRAVARRRYQEALAWFDRALALAPGLGVALFCRGLCLMATGRVAEAYAAFEESVAEDPSDPARRIHLARAALAAGETQAAMLALAPLVRDAEVADAVLEDPALAGLRDHPRFLMMCGRL